MVTVTGVGGVGKTRLALQVAAELAPGFAQGAWICELAAAATGDDMAQVVAIALGVVPRQAMTLAESIVDFLRTRHLLVVLDNCEHLLDSAAGLAAAILAGAPNVRILATSREGLAIAGEHVWPLRSLQVSQDDPQGSDAVMLFVDRAQSVDPTFALDRTTTPVVISICRRHTPSLYQRMMQRLREPRRGRPSVLRQERHGRTREPADRCGVFEIRDGLIHAWREYFDSAAIGRA